jgi:hypothetical protein
MEATGAAAVSVGGWASGVPVAVAPFPSDEQAAASSSRAKTKGQKKPVRRIRGNDVTKAHPTSLDSDAVVIDIYEQPLEVDGIRLI